MNIETYEVENSNQSEASTMAQDGEAIELIEKMGLKGQKKLLNPETATRNPYRVMSKEERTIYGAVLTQHTELGNYEDDCIPLRVLQVAAHAKDCGLFERIEVWHGEPAIFRDDPLLVGLVPAGDGYSHRYHMLARWGRELLNLEQLEAIAIKLLRPIRLDECRRQIQEATARLSILETTTSVADLSKSAHFYVS